MLYALVTCPEGTTVHVGLYVKNATDELADYDRIGSFQDPPAIVANCSRTCGA